MSLFRGDCYARSRRTVADLAAKSLWLDELDASTRFQSNSLTGALADVGDPIGGWLDKSGSGNHAVGSGGARPIVGAAGVGLTFNGSQYLDGPALAFPGDFLLLIVGSFAVATFAARLIDFDFAASLMVMHDAFADGVIAGDGSGTSPYGIQRAATDGAQHVFAIWRIAGTQFFSVDGGASATSSSLGTGAIAAKRYSIGNVGLDSSSSRSAFVLTGDVGLVVACQDANDAAITPGTTVRDAVIASTKGIWGIPLYGICRFLTRAAARERRSWNARRRRRKSRCARCTRRPVRITRLSRSPNSPPTCLSRWPRLRPRSTRTARS